MVHNSKEDLRQLIFKFSNLFRQLWISLSLWKNKCYWPSNVSFPFPNEFNHEEKKVLTALEDAGLFTSVGLVKDKHREWSDIICQQLEPDWHIDSNPEIITQLARFIKYQLHISPVKLERTASNIFTANSLEQFLGSNWAINIADFIL